MDFKVISTIIGLMEKAGLVELEIKEGETRLRLKRRVQPAVIIYPKVTPVSTKPKENPAEEQTTNENLVAITAPMDGIFYQAMAEDQPPLIKIGQTINQGDTVCIIDLMKTMNHIDSKVAGKVRRILVKDKQEVKKKQILFLLEPTQDEQDEKFEI